MSGIHLLRTGRVEANLPRLNEHFAVPFIDELIAQKQRGEWTAAEQLNWEHHQRMLGELEADLDRSYEQSALGGMATRDVVNRFLVDERLAGDLAQVLHRPTQA